MPSRACRCSQNYVSGGADQGGVRDAGGAGTERRACGGRPDWLAIWELTHERARGAAGHAGGPLRLLPRRAGLLGLRCPPPSPHGAGHHRSRLSPPKGRGMSTALCRGALLICEATLRRATCISLNEPRHRCGTRMLCTCSVNGSLSAQTHLPLETPTPLPWAAGTATEKSTLTSHRLWVPYTPLASSQNHNNEL